MTSPQFLVFVGLTTIKVYYIVNRMSISKAIKDKVQITASANDILNCEFPKLRYSALTFPGLKYLK